MVGKKRIRAPPAKPQGDIPKSLPMFSIQMKFFQCFAHKTLKKQAFWAPAQKALFSFVIVNLGGITPYSTLANIAPYVC
jgi:hypothetical protein